MFSFYHSVWFLTFLVLLIYSNKMILISTLSKSRVVFSHSSSFLPIVFTRYFSSVEQTLVQLSSDINFIYKDLTDDNLLESVSPFRLAVIQQKILSGLYVLSPLQVKYIKKVDLILFLDDTLPDFPDIQIGTGPDPGIITVVMPTEKEDGLVFMGLSLTLFRLSYGCLPKGGYRLEAREDSLNNILEQMGKVDRLYKLDLGESITKLPISLILEKVKPLVGDGSVYKLISSFLTLPIYDEYGNLRSDITCGGMPPLGEITMVLVDIVLKDIFDREFPKRFPGIAFSRFISEVFISTSENDEVLFDQKAGYALLEELSLDGKILSIGPGDEPLLCYNKKLVYLDSDSKVNVVDPMEY